MAVIASCGGGGGSGGVQAAPLPTLSEDTVPSGQRIDVSGRDYFALAAGGVWVFERTSEGLTFPQHNREVRTNGPAESPIFLIDGYPPSTTESFYRYTAEGLVSVNPLRNVQADYPAVAAALPSLLEFATPFYPQGGTRRLVRQGDAGADLDGDGRNERFRIEFTQVFLGFQAMQVMDVMTEVAGFRSTFAFTIYATRDQREVTSSSAEESYWGDGIGMVRATRSAVGPDGLPAFPTYTIRLTDASVGGLDLGPGSASSTSIPLPRRDLVYDSARSVYYATVGADDAINRNRLAVIDSSSGVTTFTREVGASPGTLALTADNSVLYVGLQGSGEVLKLALPSFQELARFRLPVEPFRRTQYLPEDLAASPTDPDLIAVSMYRPGTRFLRHSGILMARGMVPLPQRTSPLGDGNVLAFSSDGATLHSLQNESVTGGLGPVRQFSAGVGGPVLQSQVGLFTGYPFDHPELNIVDDLMTIQNNVWTTGNAPMFLGGLSDLHCSKLLGIQKIACLRQPNMLAVYGAPSLQLLGTVAFATSGNSMRWRLVPGPAGQVAIINDGAVQLFSDPLLR
jgi:hypothetical protein